MTVSEQGLDQALPAVSPPTEVAFTRKGIVPTFL